MKKSLVAGLGATALVACAATVALAGGSPATAAGEPSSAFALQSEGLIPIPATPAAEWTEGDTVTAGGQLPDNPLLTGGVLTAEAGEAHAKASVANLSIDLVGTLIANDPTGLGADGFAALSDACDNVAAAVAPLDEALAQITDPLGTTLQDVFGQLGGATADTPLTLDLLEGLELPENLDDVVLEDVIGGVCDVLDAAGTIDLGVIEAECNNAKGTANVAAAGVAEFGTIVDTVANSALGLDNVATVETNVTTDNGDGTVTVDALKISLLPGTPLANEIVIASATCGTAAKDAPPPADEPDAPAPTPGPGNLPVTG